MRFVERAQHFYFSVFVFTFYVVFVFNTLLMLSLVARPPEVSALAVVSPTLLACRRGGPCAELARLTCRCYMVLAGGGETPLTPNQMTELSKDRSRW